MAERKPRRGQRTSSLKLEFGIPTSKLPEAPVTEGPTLPERPATIPEGETYTGGNSLNLGQGKAKIYSGGRMVVDPTEQRRTEDVNNKIKDILSNPALNQTGKSEEWASVAKQVKEGRELNPLTANEAHDHIESVHRDINTFLNNLPESILAKADLHEQTAKAIQKVKRDHPEAQKQLDMASKLRETVGIPGNLSNVRDLRAAKEAVLSGGGNLTKNRDYQLNIENRLVTAATNFKLLKRGGSSFVTDSPSVNHPALKQAHSQIKSVNKAINSFLKPLGMASPVSTDKLEVYQDAVANIQGPKTSVSPMTYQDEHPETGALSKPGHIWGEKPPLGLDGVEVKGKDYREREQIPLTDEGKAYVTKTYGTQNGKRLKGKLGIHPVVTRFAAAMRSLKKDVRQKAAVEAEGGGLDLSKIGVRDDGRSDALRDQVTRGNYSEAAQARSKVNSPAAFPDASSPGTIGRQVREAAMQGANIERAENRDVNHHINVAFEALISNTKVPLETGNYIASHPKSEEIKATVERMAGAHLHAVEAFKSNTLPNQAARKILGAVGLKRAQTLAKPTAESGE